MTLFAGRFALIALVLLNVPIVAHADDADRLRASRRRMEVLNVYFGAGTSRTTRFSGTPQSVSIVGDYTLAVEWARTSRNQRLMNKAEMCAARARDIVLVELGGHDSDSNMLFNIWCQNLVTRARPHIENWPVKFEPALRDRLYDFEVSFANTHDIGLAEVELLASLVTRPTRLLDVLVNDPEDEALPPSSLVQDGLVEDFLGGLAKIVPTEAHGFATGMARVATGLDQRLGFIYERLDWSTHLPWFNFFDRPLWHKDETDRSVLIEYDRILMARPYLETLHKLRRARTRNERYVGSRAGDRIDRALTAYETLIASDLVAANERYANMVEHWTHNPRLSVKVVPGVKWWHADNIEWNDMLDALAPKFGVAPEVLELGRTADCTKYFAL